MITYPTPSRCKTFFLLLDWLFEESWELLDIGVSSTLFSGVREFTPITDAGVDEELLAGEDDPITGDGKGFYSVWAGGQIIGSLSGCLESVIKKVILVTKS